MLHETMANTRWCVLLLLLLLTVLFIPVSTETHFENQQNQDTHSGPVDYDLIQGQDPALGPNLPTSGVKGRRGAGRYNSRSVAQTHSYSFHQEGLHQRGLGLGSLVLPEAVHKLDTHHQSTSDFNKDVHTFNTDVEHFPVSGQGEQDIQSEGKRSFKSGIYNMEFGQGGHYNTRYGIGGTQFSSGTCETKLSAPMNSMLKCSSYSGCRASCLHDYAFPSGETQIFFVCENGQWRVKHSTNDTIPQCYPICIPPCQHGGNCVSPNTCDCPENFSGPYCQYERKRCVGFPPTPNNSKKICNSESCIISCLNKHQFPDGSGIANIFCKDGQWTPARPDWTTVPDCKPVCTPACQNGGSCLGFNTCNCPQQFRGPQCQYSIDVCDARKLNFNGNYNCSEVGGTFSCMVSCPVGMTFQTRPSSVYSCDYSEGVFHPNSVPQCVFSGDTNHEDNMGFIFSHGMSDLDLWKKNVTVKKYKTSDLSLGYSDLLNSLFILEEKTPTPGVCFTWAGSHYRTFDGRIISFKSSCLYTLASDAVDNTFHIQSQAASCDLSNCKQRINVYINEKQFQLAVNSDGFPIVLSGKEQFNVPNQLPGLKLEIGGHAVIATLQNLGVVVRWNLEDTVEIRVSENMWNRTGGLCGQIDGHASNDLAAVHDSVTAFASKWQVITVSDTCSDNVEENHKCIDAASQQAAHEFCNKLMTAPVFDACRKILPAREYYEACKWDFCACKEDDKSSCACDSLAMFVRDCMQKNERSAAKWRDESTCPVTCTGGRVYKACGPTTEVTCASPDVSLDNSDKCEEGCYCPKGTRLLGDMCVDPEECPCQLRGRDFRPGQKVPKDCNSCECIKGQWVCTTLQCDAKCEAIGDPHYVTFDGRRFDFMGKCSYYLLQSDNYSIEAENIACEGRISENMGYSPAMMSVTPSCTKAVTVRLGEDKILRLKQGKEITVNGEDIDKLPLSLGDAYIRAASSVFIQVELSDGVEILWDGQTRVYINAPGSLRGKTKGLCGTFNGNQKDDFLTPEGDVEQDVIAFANKWKTKEKCDNADEQKEVGHPCEVNIQNKAVAETYCRNLTSSLFADCHFLVDPAPFYADCLYDMCSCNGKTSDCFCPILASYGKECSHQGAMVDWRSKVKICGIHCPSGMQYQVCGNSCTRSCDDLTRYKQCSKTSKCVEGCFCPEGRSLDSRGECIPIATCSCMQNGMEYPAGHKEIRPGSKGLQLCACKNAQWSCEIATPEQVRDYPNHSLNSPAGCSATRHQEFTHCEPSEPVTCKNMHDRPRYTPAICRPGCICKRGYVLDSLTKECVRPKDCPCHHGGRSYSDGHKIQEDCNICTCESGKWKCTERACPGVCTAWGDSHFRTFDGRIYDFQGACDYMLAKGTIGDSDSFNVALEIVPCGSTGASCPKAVTLSVGSKQKHETVIFSSSKPIPSSVGLERIIIREAGLFVFAEVFDLGVVLQWDKGTRVMVKTDPKWKGRLRGLCGNYNNDETDDFQTPSGGVNEVSAQLFGDSWKLQPYCPESAPVEDTCELHPSRKSWAVQKCGILKSSLFKPCHSEVPIDAYLERCIFDTCACDQGGDCECLCTAIAAYAQECNAHGVHIKWRSQKLCPMQCDETCAEYSPCMQTCPQETCDNILIHKSLMKLCEQDTCIEGCQLKPCPPGQVYQNLTDLQCIPVASCKPVCLKVRDTEYYEGDFMEGDDCYRCVCSRHKKTCTGQPCTSLRPLVTSTPTPEDQGLTCSPGWTEWMSNDQPIPDKKDTDIEPLPSTKDFSYFVKQATDNNEPEPTARCSSDMMVDIECRTVGSHRNYKDLYQNVECSLEKGLECTGGCDDYEIRVLCHCGSTVQTTPSTTMTTTQTTTTEQITFTIPVTATPSTIPESEVEILRCDVLHPLSPHKTDCSRYYQCTETEYGLEQMERECAPSLWFNPVTMTCDWPNVVGEVRPECIEVVTEAGCTDLWTNWLNITHPNAENRGDFELIENIQEKGIQICSNNGYIKDIECKFYKYTQWEGAKRKLKENKKGGRDKWELADYDLSGEVVSCTAEEGLRCLNENQSDNMCEDYAVRFLCACEKKSEDIKVEKPKEKKPNRTEEGVTEPMCKDSWSDWLNITHPAENGGDLELIQNIQNKGNQICSGNKSIKDAECKFYKFASSKSRKGTKTKWRSNKGGAKGQWELADYRLSGEAVSCTKEGLRCLNEEQSDNMCEDYAVRFLCACENKTTNIEHEKPKEEKPTNQTEGQGCRSDEILSDCNIRCDQLCLFYEHVLLIEGKCKGNNRCVPGCWPADKIESCPPGFMWRDFDSCVRIDDCTCRSHKGEIVKPGTVVYESDCEICQCLNNHYTCDTSACVTSNAEEISSTTSGALILPVHHETTTTTTVARTTTTIVTTVVATTEPPLTTAGVFIVPSTVTPPPDCDREKLIPLTVDLSDSAFTASSSIDGPGFRPQDARLSSTSMGSWKPIHMNTDQYLQIDLGEVEPVYGVISRGSLEANEFVNSFYVVYSTDGQLFSYVTYQNMPEIFRGALNNYEPMLQIFNEPIEARYIRINPSSWTNGIAMNLEVLGCSIESTTMSTTEASTITTIGLKTTTMEPITTTTVEPTTAETPLLQLPVILTTLLPTTEAPVCTDVMGLDNGLMKEEQVTVSSAMEEHFSVRQASLTSPTGWSPLTNSPNEWIQFDFLDERTLTGIQTIGSQIIGRGDMPEKYWVKAYKVTYSHDGKAWNPILVDGGKEKVFMGNFDSITPHTNYFEKPIHTRYLRIYPTQWHSAISLRVEVLGCYSPYPEIKIPVITTPAYTTQTELCNICHGAVEVSPCPCSAGRWWDGEQCTTRTQCPCYVGHISYAVGSVYDTEDCEQCICSLGGTAQCAQKVCPTCEEGLQGVLTTFCSCMCKPCPESTVLCPTSNVCINSTSWCDGVIDCPDDEINCTTTRVSTTVTTSPSTLTSTEAATTSELPTTTVGPEACPPVKCPEGFKVNYKEKSSNLELQEEELIPHWSPFGTKTKQVSIVGFRKGGVKGGRGRGHKGGGSSDFAKYWNKYAHKKPRPMKLIEKTQVCPEYECVPERKEEFCPIPKCSNGYELKTVETKKGECPSYSCELNKIPDGKCNVTGRTFDTFDGTEYKYDICDHILAQDKIYKQWQIKLKMNCKYIGSCSRTLIIKQYNHTIQLNSDLSILYDGYSYTVPQMQKIGSQTYQFGIRKISDKFIIFASALTFSVIWDAQGNARVVVPGTFRGHVNGLCGFFDGKTENDKQKPDGEIARTSVEFGDSWGKTNCETKVCPIHIQNKAWEICNFVKKEPLKRCEDAVNLDKFISHCVESVCLCREANINSTEQCKCQAFLDIVTLCQANKPGVDLSTWRMVHDCPVDCPPSLVYKECYNRVCEPSCAELVEEDPCPVSESTCFPGCYCPAGLVRDGERCVRPTECRDCVCDGFGKSRFITFDRVDYTFNGNCSYVLAKTIENTSGPKFKVLVSNGPCENSLEETCVKSVTLVFEDHTVVLGSVGNDNKVSVLVDGMKVMLPVKNSWTRIVQSPKKSINLAVPELQMDLLFHGTDQGFSLQLPSHLYHGRTEGLCGSCNANQTDDIKTSTNEIMEDTDKFGKSWLATDLPDVLGTEELCSVTPPKNECTLLPPNEDLCLKLMDEDLFGKCHPVVNPIPFLSACHESWCEEGTTNCRELEAYARECEASGVCLKWRSERLCPYSCPPGMLYKACGLGCEITCDNHELFDADPEACTKPRTDACVCPPGQVLKNSTCVLVTRCQPCDAEGHYPGDVWNPDTCTKCTCENGNNVQCQRIQCPALSTICQRGHKSIIVKGTESDCCPKYICVPEPKEETKCLPSQQQPVCGFGQIMKMEISEDGCQEFICQCFPVEECPDTSTEMAAAAEQPGMVAVVNDSGCCPRVDVVCKPETCPPPPECKEEFYEPVARDVERCCSQYRCEPPKEKCLYEFEFIDADQGGERRRLPFEKYTAAKKGSEVWQDGPCHSCYCKEPEYRAVCTKHLCEKAPADVDYVITAQAKPKQCCPVYQRTACKVGDTVYEEGDIWQSPNGDRCKNISCVRGQDGELTQQESVQTCNKECPIGWRYMEPLIFSLHCCGKCEPFACVVDGIVHNQNTEWYSADNCTSYTCDISGKQVQVTSAQEQCPNVDDCPQDKRYKEGCCTKCNITIQSQNLCSPEPLPANKTVNLVRTVLASHGICENYDAIPNFTECRGTCDSYTFYNQKTGVHDTMCLCCQAVDYSNVPVKLRCEDGFTLEKKVPIPSACNCEACGEEEPKPHNAKGRHLRFTKS